MKRRNLSAGLVSFVAMLSWMGDAGNSQLFAFALPQLAKEWALSPTAVAAIGFGPLAAAVAGGAGFGWMQDRWGRKRGFLLSLAVYTMAAGLTALAQGPAQMVLARLLTGITLGGTWATGMTLVSEISGPSTRGKAVALVQVGFPLGYVWASLLTYFLAPAYGWRGTFGGNFLYGLIMLALVSRVVTESPVWLATRYNGSAAQSPAKVAWGRKGRGLLWKTSLLSFLGMLGYWAVTTWLPTFLEELGFARVSLWSAAIMVGGACGYLVHGIIGDYLGRRTAMGIYFVLAALAALLLGIYPILIFDFKGPFAWAPILLLSLTLAFGMGYFSGYGAYYAELYPTAYRGVGVGFSFNVGRLGTALGPIFMSSLARSVGPFINMSLTSIVFALAALLLLWLPETYVRNHEDGQGLSL